LRVDRTVADGGDPEKSCHQKIICQYDNLIRLHLMSYVELLEFVKDTYMACRKANSPPSPFA
jgi:hypothetical protein